MVGAGGATSLPRIPPTWSVPEQDGGTTPTPPLRSLVVAPVVHVHGVMQGDVTAVISAGYEYCFDAEHSLTPCNLVGRLFLRAAAEASRLIRLGCLSGCANEDICAAGVPKQRVVPLPTGAPPRRTPAELAKDLEAYLHVVTLGHYAKMFALSESNVEAVVIQAVHLAETVQNATVVSATIKVINTWALHTVSGTTSGVKQKMLDYYASMKDFCNRAAAPPASQPDGVVVPVSRHVVVAFLDF